MAQATAMDRDQLAAGVITMIATAAGMAFGDALVKKMSADLGLWQLFVLRSVFALPLLALLVRATIRDRRVSRSLLLWGGLRSLLLIGMWVSFYAALTMVDLATVATAYYTGPIIITLLSAWLAGETVGARRWLAVCAGFAGVVLMLRPGESGLDWPVAFAVLSGFFYAVAAVLTRTRLSGASSLMLSASLNLAFFAVGLLGSVVLVLLPAPDNLVAAHPFLFGNWRGMDAGTWASVALLAVLIVAITTGVARAYQIAPSSIIATFDYVYLPFAGLWGFVFFATVPDLITLAGMLLIGGAGIAILRTQRRSSSCLTITPAAASAAPSATRSTPVR
jgi:drug/metabolite transporter (DMT)-like permease